ncbi:MAG TPA: DUF4012 domain-containing protein [Candidatus Paceibacterota bacterium]|jgi:hypothetical protein|nr:DUF4012 domain-containing protein [Candidatus Paceibacterota bacterium]
MSLKKRDDDVRPEDLIKVIKKEPEDKGLKNIPVTPGNYGKFMGNRPPLPRGIVWGIVGLVAFFVVGFLTVFFVVRGKVQTSLATNATALRAGVADLQDLNTASATEEFSALAEANGSSSGIGSVMSAFGFLFKGGTSALSSFSNLAGELATFSTELNSLQTNGFAFLVSGQGGALITELSSLRDTMNAISDTSNDLSNAVSLAGGSSSLGENNDVQTYLSLQSQLASAENFLNVFIPWLSEPTTHHMLVFLDNPSEMRPGGGFLGSYADISIASGNITNVSVHDIADADLAFTKNVVPPQQLQLIVTRWRPADANWFFDFPTSASKTIQFFDESTLYAPTSTAATGAAASSTAGTTPIDGAIAVTPQVVNDLLSMTGPITVGAPTTTFTSDNFLVQIQKIVQDGQATDATYPKQVLRNLSQAIFADLASSTDDQKAELLSDAENWVADRDVMVYFEDPTLENFVQEYGASGEVYQLPQTFNGDYFADVDANVGGGKSDLYVSSTVQYTAEINADGTLTDNVTITRAHHGNKSPYWWYQTTNQDYLQLFVPEGSTLQDETGGVIKKITAPVNYAKSGYSTDPTVVTLEASTTPLFTYPAVTEHDESGKEVFATWSTVKAGASTQLNFDYTHSLFLPPAAGVQYQFIFEKEAGTSREYQIEIDAPLGYVFAENGLASYDYDSDTDGPMPGTMVVNLTLQPLQD